MGSPRLGEEGDYTQMGTQAAVYEGGHRPGRGTLGQAIRGRVVCREFNILFFKVYFIDCPITVVTFFFLPFIPLHPAPPPSHLHSPP